MTNLSERPYVLPYGVEVSKSYQGQIGYDKIRDIRIKLSGVAWPDLIVSVAWNEEEKLIPGTLQTQKKITKADVGIFYAGMGWTKKEEVEGYMGKKVKWSERIIQFEKRFLLIMPWNQALKEVPILNSADVTKSYLVEVHGVLDIVSFVGVAEMIFV